MKMLALVLAAMMMVESSGGVEVIGDGGAAVGPLQIHRIYVDDVNRIAGAEIFDYEDRYAIEASARMFCIYVGHYGTAARLGRPVRWEDLCRIHNGGPDGWKKEATRPYWAKVQAALAELEGHR